MRMEFEQVADISLIVELCLLTAIRTYYKTKYSRVLSFRALHYEPRLLVMLRWLLGSALLALLVAILWRKADSPVGTLTLTPVVRIIGAFGGLSALMLIRAAHHALGPAFSTTVDTEHVQNIITDGCYRWIRHPMYAGYLLLFLHLGLLSANWLFALLGIAIILSLVIIRAPYEEQALLMKFPIEYGSYMKTTGALFPRIFKQR